MLLLVQVSIAKQLKSTLGIEDSTKIGFLVHVSASLSNNVLRLSCFGQGALHMPEKGLSCSTVCVYMICFSGLDTS